MNRNAFRQYLRRILPYPLLIPATKAIHVVRPGSLLATSNRLYNAIGRPEIVMSGPFAGMAYISESRGSLLCPKLLGTYEMELNDIVRQIIVTEPDRVIDVGSAEGYYAVGFARALPQAQIHCYDTDRYANYLLRQLARKNNVQDRIAIHGFCSCAELQRQLKEARRALVVCDCEGFESELLQLSAVSALSSACVLVELHDMFVPGVSEQIRGRFAATHEIITIDSRPRTRADWTAKARLSEQDELDAMAENRGATMTWFYMKPRHV